MDRNLISNSDYLILNGAVLYRPKYFLCLFFALVDGAILAISKNAHAKRPERKILLYSGRKTTLTLGPRIQGAYKSNLKSPDFNAPLLLKVLWNARSDGK
jgi:hypothetical protein